MFCVLFGVGVNGAKGFQVTVALSSRRRNTIDLFVMSLCPSGQQVETELIDQLRAAPAVSCRRSRSTTSFTRVPKTRGG